MDVKFDRRWAMRNKETFKILPIKMLLMAHMDAYREETKSGIVIVDPFAGNSNNLIDIIQSLNIQSYRLSTNDLNPECFAVYHMDALVYLRGLDNQWADIIIFDPPYSPRQVAEYYKQVGRERTQQDTQSKFWGDCKKEIARISKKDGIVISCGWNSNGIGKTLGFKIIDGLIVPHGGNHNDTIVTVERKQCLN